MLSTTFKHTTINMRMLIKFFISVAKDVTDVRKENLFKIIHPIYSCIIHLFRNMGTKIFECQNTWNISSCGVSEIELQVFEKNEIFKIMTPFIFYLYVISSFLKFKTSNSCDNSCDFIAILPRIDLCMVNVIVLLLIQF